MRLRPVTSVTATAVSLAMLAACTGGGSTSSVASVTAQPSATSPVPSGTSTSVSPTPTTSSAPTTAPAAASLTGLPGTAGKPVIAVKIDNTPPARPQTNVNGADIVYVEEVEGAATRLMAVFQSTLPDIVGPVRSGRESDLEILAAYGKVALVYSGAQPAVNAMIRASPQRAYEEGAPGFFRSSDRHAPYNLYFRPNNLLAAHADLPAANDIGFVFGDALPGGKPVTSVSATMTPYVKYGFTYDAAHQRWLASIAGNPTVQKDGARLWATNVLVQQVTVNASQFHDVLGNNTPRTHTVGTGKFWLVRPDGTVFTGTWKRAKASSPTTYTDSSGVPVTFAPGRTWVLLAPKGNSVTVK